MRNIFVSGITKNFTNTKSAEATNVQNKNVRIAMLNLHSDVESSEILEQRHEKVSTKDKRDAVNSTTYHLVLVILADELIEFFNQLSVFIFCKSHIFLRAKTQERCTRKFFKSSKLNY